MSSQIGCRVTYSDIAPALKLHHIGDLLRSNLNLNLMPTRMDTQMHNDAKTCACNCIALTGLKHMQAYACALTSCNLTDPGSLFSAHP